MLIEKSGLPFPRGTTFSQAAGNGLNPLVTLTDTIAKNLEGRTFQVPDTIHNTGHFITLRVVKADVSGGTGIPVERHLQKFSSVAPEDWGRRIAGVATEDGTDVCKPLDDAYYYGTENTATHQVQTTIADQDLFYVIEEGPCHILADTTKFAVGGAAAPSSSDGLASVAAAGDFAFGTALEVNDTAASTATLFYVRAGISQDAP